jgi:hypothetical protein
VPEMFIGGESNLPALIDEIIGSISKLSEVAHAPIGGDVASTLTREMRETLSTVSSVVHEIDNLNTRGRQSAHTIKNLAVSPSPAAATQVAGHARALGDDAMTQAQLVARAATLVRGVFNDLGHSAPGLVMQLQRVERQMREMLHGYPSAQMHQNFNAASGAQLPESVRGQLTAAEGEYARAMNKLVRLTDSVNSRNPLTSTSPGASGNPNKPFDAGRLNVNLAELAASAGRTTQTLNSLVQQLHVQLEASQRLSAASTIPRPLPPATATDGGSRRPPPPPPSAPAAASAPEPPPRRTPVPPPLQGPAAAPVYGPSLPPPPPKGNIPVLGTPREAPKPLAGDVPVLGVPREATRPLVGNIPTLGVPREALRPPQQPPVPPPPPYTPRRDGGPVSMDDLNASYARRIPLTPIHGPVAPPVYGPQPAGPPPPPVGTIPTLGTPRQSLIDAAATTAMLTRPRVPESARIRPADLLPTPAELEAAYQEEMGRVLAGARLRLGGNKFTTDLSGANPINLRTMQPATSNSELVELRDLHEREGARATAAAQRAGGTSPGPIASLVSGFTGSGWHAPGSGLSSITGSAGVLGRYALAGQGVSAMFMALSQGAKAITQTDQAFYQLDEAMRATDTRSVDTSAAFGDMAQYGVDGAQALQVAANAMQAYRGEIEQGAKATDVMNESMKQAGILAAITGQSVADASKQLTEVSFGRGTGYKEQGATNDVIASVGRNYGITDKSQISQAMAQSSDVAQIAGLDQAQQGNILGAMIKTGTTGSAAATQLSEMVSRSGKGPFQGLMTQLGVANTGNLLQEITGISRAMEGMTESRQKAILSQVGEGRSMRALLAVLSQAGAINDNVARTENAHGLAAEEAGRHSRTLTGEMQTLGAALKSITQELAHSGILAPLGLMLQALVPVVVLVDKMIGSFESLTSHIPIIGKQFGNLAGFILDAYLAMRLFTAISNAGGLGTLLSRGRAALPGAGGRGPSGPGPLGGPAPATGGGTGGGPRRGPLGGPAPAPTTTATPAGSGLRVGGTPVTTTPAEPGRTVLGAPGTAGATAPPTGRARFNPRRLDPFRDLDPAARAPDPRQVERIERAYTTMGAPITAPRYRGFAQTQAAMVQQREGLRVANAQKAQVESFATASRADVATEAAAGRARVRTLAESGAPAHEVIDAGRTETERITALRAQSEAEIASRTEAATKNAAAMLTAGETGRLAILKGAQDLALAMEEGAVGIRGAAAAARATSAANMVTGRATPVKGAIPVLGVPREAAARAAAAAGTAAAGAAGTAGAVAGGAAATAAARSFRVTTEQQLAAPAAGLGSLPSQYSTVTGPMTPASVTLPNDRAQWFTAPAQPGGMPAAYVASQQASAAAVAGAAATPTAGPMAYYSAAARAQAARGGAPAPEPATTPGTVMPVPAAAAVATEEQAAALRRQTRAAVTAAETATTPVTSAAEATAAQQIRTQVEGVAATGTPMPMYGAAARAATVRGAMPGTEPLAAPAAAGGAEATAAAQAAALRRQTRAAVTEAQTAGAAVTTDAQAAAQRRQTRAQTVAEPVAAPPAPPGAALSSEAQAAALRRQMRTQVAAAETAAAPVVLPPAPGGTPIATAAQAAAMRRQISGLGSETTTPVASAEQAAAVRRQLRAAQGEPVAATPAPAAPAAPYYSAAARAQAARGAQAAAAAAPPVLPGAAASTAAQAANVQRQIRAHAAAMETAVTTAVVPPVSPAVTAAAATQAAAVRQQIRAQVAASETVAPPPVTPITSAAQAAAVRRQIRTQPEATGTVGDQTQAAAARREARALPGQTYAPVTSGAQAAAVQRQTRAAVAAAEAPLPPPPPAPFRVTTEQTPGGAAFNRGQFAYNPVSAVTPSSVILPGDRAQWMTAPAQAGGMPAGFVAQQQAAATTAATAAQASRGMPMMLPMSAAARTQMVREAQVRAAGGAEAVVPKGTVPTLGVPREAMQPLKGTVPTLGVPREVTEAQLAEVRGSGAGQAATIRSQMDSRVVAEETVAQAAAVGRASAATAAGSAAVFTPPPAALPAGALPVAAGGSPMMIPPVMPMGGGKGTEAAAGDADEAKKTPKEQRQAAREERQTAREERQKTSDEAREGREKARTEAQKARADANAPRQAARETAQARGRDMGREFGNRVADAPGNAARAVGGKLSSLRQGLAGAAEGVAPGLNAPVGAAAGEAAAAARGTAAAGRVAAAGSALRTGATAAGSALSTIGSRIPGAGRLMSAGAGGMGGMLAITGGIMMVQQEYKSGKAITGAVNAGNDALWNAQQGDLGGNASRYGAAADALHHETTTVTGRAMTAGNWVAEHTGISAAARFLGIGGGWGDTGDEEGNLRRHQQIADAGQKQVDAARNATPGGLAASVDIHNANQSYTNMRTSGASATSALTAIDQAVANASRNAIDGSKGQFHLLAGQQGVLAGQTAGDAMGYLADHIDKKYFKDIKPADATNQVGAALKGYLDKAGPDVSSKDFAKFTEDSLKTAMHLTDKQLADDPELATQIHVAAAGQAALARGETIGYHGMSAQDLAGASDATLSGIGDFKAEATTKATIQGTAGGATLAGARAAEGQLRTVYDADAAKLAELDPNSSDAQVLRSKMEAVKGALDNAEIATSDAVRARIELEGQLAASALSPFDKTGQIDAQLSALQTELNTPNLDDDKKKQIQTQINQLQAQRAQQVTADQNAGIMAGADSWDPVATAQATLDAAKNTLAGIRASGAPENSEAVQNALKAVREDTHTLITSQLTAASNIARAALDPQDTIGQDLQDITDVQNEINQLKKDGLKTTTKTIDNATGRELSPDEAKARADADAAGGGGSFGGGGLFGALGGALEGGGAGGGGSSTHTVTSTEQTNQGEIAAKQIQADAKLRKYQQDILAGQYSMQVAAVDPRDIRRLNELKMQNLDNQLAIITRPDGSFVDQKQAGDILQQKAAQAIKTAEDKIGEQFAVATAMVDPRDVERLNALKLDNLNKQLLALVGPDGRPVDLTLYSNKQQEITAQLIKTAQDKLSGQFAMQVAAVDPRDVDRINALKMKNLQAQLTALTGPDGKPVDKTLYGNKQQEIAAQQITMQQRALDTANAQYAATIMPGDKQGDTLVALQKAQQNLVAAGADALKQAQARKEIATAAAAEADARLEASQVHSGLTQDLTDPRVVAQRAVEAAQQHAADVEKQTKGMDPASAQRLRDAAATGVIAAQNSQAETLVATNLSMWSQELSLHRISGAKYIELLKKQRADVENNSNISKHEKELLENQIDQAIQDANQQLQGQFNLSDIKLPTIYEVRRAATSQGGHVIDASSTTNNVSINGVDFAKVVSYINSLIAPGGRVVTPARKG